MYVYLHRRAAYSICESSFLIHHGIYHDLFVCLCNDHSLTKRFTTRTERLTKCFEPLQKLRVRLGTCKTGLSPSVIYITDRSKAIILWLFLLFYVLVFNFFLCCWRLIVSLFFSHLGFWSGNLFLIAPFPDLCLLVPFYVCYHILVRFR